MNTHSDPRARPPPAAPPKGIGIGERIRRLSVEAQFAKVKHKADTLADLQKRRKELEAQMEQDAVRNDFETAGNVVVDARATRFARGA